MQGKTFKAGLNFSRGETYAVIIIPIIVAACLIFFGMRYNPLFPAEASGTWRILFVYIPIVFAVIIIIGAFIAIIDNLLIKITITHEFLYLKKGGSEMKAKWKVLAFAPPQPGKKRLRNFSVGDGNILIWVNEIFFPGFEKIVDLIKTAKKKSNVGGYNV
ncbi:MAG: hypothetical protein K8T10_14520 [Candidatus Eremiobacteraeota bacterium]|nr:hypothetical protein [Candidatus Eremiobacteraeota bacterium]